MTARSRPADIAEEAFIAADLSTADGVRAVVAETNSRVAGLDILVNTLWVDPRLPPVDSPP
ncbi:hypothetical protein [Nocardia sp. NBC_00403]|uniref:hypothetical protein n=1 Tax=Nocardia sp. NBC_00403 TaxID=2975990 RepID=UPI002E1C386B